MGIEHVVVLMYENRSFDHMLGLLDHPDPAFPRIRTQTDEFSNPLDPTDPDSPRVQVTDDGTYDIPHDPPHGHLSVLEQLGLRSGGPSAMDGFVAAYSRKVAGNEPGRPVVHWRRVIGLVVVLTAVVAALCALPRWTPLLFGAATVAIVSEAVVGGAYKLRTILPVDDWRPAFVIPVAGTAVVAALSAVLGVWWGYPLRLVALFLLLLPQGLRVVLAKRKRVNTPPHVDPDEARHVMRCLRPEKLPALATLAKSFAVCTRWHCSVPGATWPNRNFTHAGTSDDTVDIEVRLYFDDTVFDRLEAAGKTWHIYRHPDGLAQVMAFGRLWDDAHLPNWYRVDDFAAHVAADALPAYSFIEPCHDGPRSNSQHPGNNRRPHPGQLVDFERGEQLLISVYETLRARPDVFAKTALIVTYDEHGGLYDHVPPPTDFPAPALIRRHPFDLSRIFGWLVVQPHSRFLFRVLGPRVPAVVVSPLVPPTVDDTLYDHTAIPATVRRLFAPGTPPLSAREARSNTLTHLWSLQRPRTDLPDLRPSLRPSLRQPAAAAPAPPRDDEFVRQLHQLGGLVRDELAPDRAAEDAAGLFTSRAETARGA